MKDYLLKAEAADGYIRMYCAVTKDTTDMARKLHQTTPVATAALGRTLTAAALIGAMLKNANDSITISIKGDGVLGGVLAVSDNKSSVRGYVLNPDTDMPNKPNGKLDVGGAIGRGKLTLIRDMGLKEPYVGTIDLISGEIADDLTYYYAKSEQIPTSVALGVLVDIDFSVKQSGGFIIQLLPGAGDDIAEKIQDSLASLPPLTSLLDEGKTAEDIIRIVLADFTVNIIDETYVNYCCNCSRERVENSLVTVGKMELSKICEEDKGAEVSCHFCDKKYYFSEEDLLNLLNRL